MTQYQANKVDKCKLNADQRRGVIIIIWHQVCPVIGFTVLFPHLLVQAGSEPIHFPYVMQSFPHFSLGAVSSLVRILMAATGGLSSMFVFYMYEHIISIFYLVIVDELQVVHVCC